jgi:hypothetical protein
MFYKTFNTNIDFVYELKENDYPIQKLDNGFKIHDTNV